MAADFYVYEHARGDTCAVFYVGKGSGDRCKSKQGRNKWWRNIVQKAGPPAIRIVARGLDEELAHLVEMERIDQHRLLGTRLTNMTDGGEGMSGYKVPPEVIARRALAQRGQKRPCVSAKLKGRMKSTEHRAALAIARTGTKASEEARLKMSQARKGRPSTMLGKKHRIESRAKISAAITGEKNPFFGKTHSEASRERMSASHSGVKASDQTRARMSAARTGEKNPRFGKPIPDEQKQRQIAALKARPRVACPHCAKTMDESNAKRWHLDNCREKN